MRPSYRLGLAALIAAIAAPAQAETPAPIELLGYVQLERVTTDANAGSSGSIPMWSCRAIG